MSGLEIKSIEQAQNVCLVLIEKYGIKIGVLITLGEKGVVYSNIKKELVHQQAKKVKVVDTSVFFFYF